jgi:amidase
MRPSEYARYDGLGLAELVRRKEVTAGELAQLAQEAVERVNPQLNAVVEVFADRVEAPDEELNPDGPFGGVPFMLKDLGAGEAGRKQELGSRLARGRVAGHSDELTGRFKEAGLNIIGRTTCSEFAQSGNTDTLLNGLTRTPWDLGRSAGGSSGGAAAAVAAGIVPLAHGNDGGGSIRIPASSCGVVGLKPSRGRVTMGPLADEGIFGVAIEFALCRTVRDVAALLDAVCQPAVGDPFLIVPPQRPYRAEVGAPVPRLRIGFTTVAWTGVPVHPDAVEAVRAVARQCAALGHDLEEVSLGLDKESFDRDFNVLWRVDLAATVDAVAQEMGREASAQTLEPVNLQSYQQGKRVTAVELTRALQGLNRIRRRTGQLFAQYDLLLSPTINGPAFLPGVASTKEDMSYEEWILQDAAASPFTALFNITGTPAISLPLYTSQAGLPIGLQFAARFGGEDLLIRLASALEEAAPWQDRLPPVHVSRAG